MDLRHDWTVDEAEALIGRPFHDLLADAQAVHRARFDPHVVEAAILLSVKTGACPEDCAYCPQSARWNTGLEPERLMPTEDIVAAARNAQASGATRFCMGAAWRSPTDRQVEEVSEAVAAVADLGMETCVTLGMLTPEQSSAWPTPGWTSTTTTWTPRRSSTARSSPPAPTTTASTPWPTCATPA
jgi:biotin synthase